MGAMAMATEATGIGDVPGTAHQETEQRRAKKVKRDAAVPET